jgi:hypothetical protein
MKRARKKSSTKAKASKRRSPATKRRAESKTKSGRTWRTPARDNFEPLDHLIAAAAHALDLKVEPAWIPTIRANLRVIFSQASLVDEFTLRDDIEPAPVFEA